MALGVRRQQLLPLLLAVGVLAGSILIGCGQVPPPPAETWEPDVSQGQEAGAFASPSGRYPVDGLDSLEDRLDAPPRDVASRLVGEAKTQAVPPNRGEYRQKPLSGERPAPAEGHRAGPEASAQRFERPAPDPMSAIGDEAAGEGAEVGAARTESQGQGGGPPPFAPGGKVERPQGSERAPGSLKDRRILAAPTSEADKAGAEDTALASARSDPWPAGPQVPSSPIPGKGAPGAPLMDEKDASKEPFSTFSLHVSDVSFKLAQAVLDRGQWPQADRIRIEEFVNAFDYGDPLPSQEDKVSCRLEQSVHPFLQQRNLLRIAIRTAAAGRAAATPLRLTFLLDTSGSMERFDRRETVARAFGLLAAGLTPADQVTLIGFARQPRLVADRMSGAEGPRLAALVAGLPSEGGTNLEAALALGFEKARQQQLAEAQNRVVLMTDGAANLGDADPERLARLIVAMRGAGIAFDAAGIGADGLNDAILEALTRQGDGRYYLLDRPEDADAGFARQIAGALRPAARNLKVQVAFDPDRVGRYRLLGFAKHRLRREDFRDDSVDAAELAAAEAGVALYQLEVRPDGQGDVGSVAVRFKDTDSGRMIERRWPIPYEPSAPRLEASAPSERLAAAAALFAARLGADPLGQVVELPALARLLANLPPGYRETRRVAELAAMIEQARRMESEPGP